MIASQPTHLEKTCVPQGEESETTANHVQLFSEKARAISAVVKTVATIRQALDYAIGLCERTRSSRHGDEGSRVSLAAPSLSSDDLALLNGLCNDHNIDLLHHDLRNNLQGIDLGLTYADYGIAETGTLVINSTGEDLRLATMVTDIHLAVLPVSRIRQDDREIASELHALLADPKNYTAFITGPSRTADIERVLAIGVHGPLELHILLLEDPSCQTARI